MIVFPSALSVPSYVPFAAGTSTDTLRPSTVTFPHGIPVAS